MNGKIALSIFVEVCELMQQTKNHRICRKDVPVYLAPLHRERSVYDEYEIMDGINNLYAALVEQLYRDLPEKRAQAAVRRLEDAEEEWLASLCPHIIFYI